MAPAGLLAGATTFLLLATAAASWGARARVERANNAQLLQAAVESLAAAGRIAPTTSSQQQQEDAVVAQTAANQDSPLASSSSSQNGGESGVELAAAAAAAAANETQSYGPLLELNALEAAERGYFRHSIAASVIVTIAYSMIFLIGLVGNSFVVTIVCKSPRMRTVTNYFIANLALADILVLLFCLPATLVGNLFIPYVLGQWVCKTVSYLQGVAVSASINTMVAVTLDRFLAICFPMDWHMSRRTARWVIACIWLFSLTIALPWALFFRLMPYPHEEFTVQVCMEDWPSAQMGNLYFVFANLILLYLFPAVVITFCYLGIWYKIERRNIPGDRPKGLNVELIMQKSKLKVIKMMMVVVLMFLLSWFPTYVIFVRLKLFGDERGEFEDWLIRNTMPFAQWLGASNSCINPILYTFFNRKYKRGFADLLRFAFCCKPLIKSGASLAGQSGRPAGRAGGTLLGQRGFAGANANGRSERQQQQQQEAAWGGGGGGFGSGFAGARRNQRGLRNGTLASAASRANSASAAGISAATATTSAATNANGGGGGGAGGNGGAAAAANLSSASSCTPPANGRSLACNPGALSALQARDAGSLAALELAGVERHPLVRAARRWAGDEAEAPGGRRASGTGKARCSCKLRRRSISTNARPGEQARGAGARPLPPQPPPQPPDELACASTPALNWSAACAAGGQAARLIDLRFKRRQNGRAEQSQQQQQQQQPLQPLQPLQRARQPFWKSAAGSLVRAASGRVGGGAKGAAAGERAELTGEPDCERRRQSDQRLEEGRRAFGCDGGGGVAAARAVSTSAGRLGLRVERELVSGAAGGGRADPRAKPDGAPAAARSAQLESGPSAHLHRGHHRERRRRHHRHCHHKQVGPEAAEEADAGAHQRHHCGHRRGHHHHNHHNHDHHHDHHHRRGRHHHHQARHRRHHANCDGRAGEGELGELEELEDWRRRRRQHTCAAAAAETRFHKLQAPRACRSTSALAREPAANFNGIPEAAAAAAAAVMPNNCLPPANQDDKLALAAAAAGAREGAGANGRSLRSNTSTNTTRDTTDSTDITTLSGGGGGGPAASLRAASLVFIDSLCSSGPERAAGAAARVLLASRRRENNERAKYVNSDATDSDGGGRRLIEGTASAASSSASASDDDDDEESLAQEEEGEASGSGSNSAEDDDDDDDLEAHLHDANCERRLRRPAASDDDGEEGAQTTHSQADEEADWVDFELEAAEDEDLLFGSDDSSPIKRRQMERLRRERKRETAATTTTTTTPGANGAAMDVGEHEELSNKPRPLEKGGGRGDEFGGYQVAIKSLAASGSNLASLAMQKLSSSCKFRPRAGVGGSP